MDRRVFLGLIGAGGVAVASHKPVNEYDLPGVPEQEQEIESATGVPFDETLPGTQAITELLPQPTGLMVRLADTPQVSVNGSLYPATNIAVLSRSHDAVDAHKKTHYPNGTSTVGAFLFETNDNYGIKTGVYDVYALYIPEGDSVAKYGDKLRIRINDRTEARESEDTNLIDILSTDNISR